MKGFVYLITRNDDLKYIGITYDVAKRMSAHKKTKRFAIGIKNIEILKEYDTYEEAEAVEADYIKIYDTYYNGLNESIDGKGNHLSLSFTTKGFKFLDKSKNKMKNSHWSKTGKYRPVGVKHSEETKQRWSALRKGKSWGPRKIPVEIALEIQEAFESDKLTFDFNFIRKYVKKTHKSLVETTPIEDLKAPNGKFLNKIKLYSEYYAEKYSVTPAAIKMICVKGIADECK